MTTSFSSLPIIDLHDLTLNGTCPTAITTRLSEELYDAFATTGFAYLVNVPLTFDHESVFELARRFFALPLDEKMRLARKSFKPGNQNTYRGYFPVQPESATDNLKEGFEIGSADYLKPLANDIFQHEKFRLTEPNVWPDSSEFHERAQLEQLHRELQNLSSQLLSLLAQSLRKDASFFSDYLEGSLSTLRLLHYPCVQEDSSRTSASRTSLDSADSDYSSFSHVSGAIGEDKLVKLSCTPHTDSGILTLLHQDSTGGLEVRNSIGQWVPAPYVPGSIVVNIGDLMAEVSGGRFVATLHRVRTPMNTGKDGAKPGQFGRFSVPFFFEPGETCVVRSVDDDGTGHGIVYGEHVRSKMKTWVEFQDDEHSIEGSEVSL